MNVLSIARKEKPEFEAPALLLPISKPKLIK